MPCGWNNVCSLSAAELTERFSYENLAQSMSEDDSAVTKAWRQYVGEAKGVKKGKPKRTFTARMHVFDHTDVNGRGGPGVRFALSCWMRGKKQFTASEHTCPLQLVRRTDSKWLVNGGTVGANITLGVGTYDPATGVFDFPSLMLSPGAFAAAKEPHYRMPKPKKKTTAKATTTTYLKKPSEHVAVRQRPWARLSAPQKAAAAELGWHTAEHWDGGMETAATGKGYSDLQAGDRQWDPAYTAYTSAKGRALLTLGFDSTTWQDRTFLRRRQLRMESLTQALKKLMIRHTKSQQARPVLFILSVLGTWAAFFVIPPKLEC